MSGSLLKILACVAMVFDHIATFFPELVPGIGTVLFSVGGKGISLGYIMNAIGRMAFPIFAFLITEGFVHTGNRRKYALNLLIFAVVSEMPFNLACSGTMLYPKQNVFFTLLLGYLGLCALENCKKNGSRYPLWFLLALFIISIFLRADYGSFGFALVIITYILRDNKILLGIVGSCILPSKLIGGVAYLPIYFYNGKRGFVKNGFAKYFFYLFYPLHLIILYLISIL